MLNDQEVEELQGMDLDDTPFLKLNHIWDIFRLNKQALEDDFRLITREVKSQPISKTNTVIGDGQIFEEGAKVECSILNV
ncbi:MAG: putative sugar nucleotidyl transferase [Saprospiraceae bacterium]